VLVVPGSGVGVRVGVGADVVGVAVFVPTVIEPLVNVVVIGFAKLSITMLPEKVIGDVPLARGVKLTVAIVPDVAVGALPDKIIAKKSTVPPVEFIVGASE
jgi:hypothetical protein